MRPQNLNRTLLQIAIVANMFIFHTHEMYFNFILNKFGLVSILEI